jgi:hypothetical protein
MMRPLITAAIFLAVSMPVQAGHRHRHRDHRHQAHHSLHRHHAARRSAHRRRTRRPQQARSERHGRQHPARAAARHGGGIVTVSTAAGPITVASHLAERFQALIADFVAHGYKPRHIGCLAHGGHVPHSRHYAGAACDFDQRGWGLTVPFMYHARAIIARHGFRDGCSFNDCGHVDDGLSVRHAQRRWHGNEDDG